MQEVQSDTIIGEEPVYTPSEQEEDDRDHAETKPLMKPEADHAEEEETLRLLEQSVTKASFMGTGLAITNRIIFVIFAVYAAHEFGASSSQAGIFFVMYAILGVLSGVVLTWVGDRFGFDYATEALLIIPLGGLCLAIPANTFSLFSFGIIFSATTMAANIIIESYIGKLSKLAPIVNPNETTTGFAKKFVPTMVLYKLIGYISGPIIAGAIFSEYSRGPFIAGLAVCTVFAVFGFFFLVGDYNYLVQRTGFRDVQHESESDFSNYDQMMILRVSLLALSRFCGACGAHAVQAFYILFMTQKFGVSPLYIAGQMTVKSCVGFSAAMFLRRFHAYLNTYYAMLAGAILALCASMTMYFVTKHPTETVLEWTWFLYVFDGIGHVFAFVNTNITLIETSSRGFVSRASLIMGGLSLSANGIGPFLFAFSGLNLFIFQSALRLCSIILFCLFLCVNAFAFTNAQSM